MSRLRSLEDDPVNLPIPREEHTVLASEPKDLRTNAGILQVPYLEPGDRRHLTVKQILKLLRIIPFLILLVFVQTASGGEWVKQPTSSLAWFRTIHFADAERGFIGGSKGALLQSIDGGKTWRVVRKFTGDTIRKIHFTDRQHGWALCERDIYSLGEGPPSYLMRTEDGGKTWVKHDFEDSNRRRITNLVFTRSGFGLALGEMGTLYALENDRLSWQKVLAPTRFLMLDGAFAGEFVGAIVGGGGMILYTEDAGVTWGPAVVSEKLDSMLKSVYFVDRSHGWTVGANGSIYQTINGGKYWRLQKSNLGTDLSGVYFTDNANGWAIGEQGTILHTTSGGNIWRETRTASRNNLEDIRFFNGTGWIVGFGGTILKYEEGIDTRRKPKLQR